MEAVSFGLARVWLATLPHPYKPLGLFVGALTHREETFLLSTKTWGQIDICS